MSVTLTKISTNRLEWIDISESNDIQTLSIHGNRLRTLMLMGQGLKVVDVENCQYLLSLSLARVHSLKELRGLDNNHSLQRIQISDAPNLNHLSGLKQITRVAFFDYSYCLNWRTYRWRRLINYRN